MDRHTAAAQPTAPGSIATLHSGDFTNAQQQQCHVELELHVIDAMTHDYNVRSSKRGMVRNGGRVEVSTTETVETFYSMKAAARAYNWNLYMLAAGQADSDRLRLDAP